MRFIRLLARTLHQYGTAAHRLETAVGAAAQRLGLRVDVFSTPTSVFLSFNATDDESSDAPTHLLRLQPGTVDVGKLAQTDAIAESVTDGSMSVDEGINSLREIARTGAFMPWPVQLLSWAVVGSAVAKLLGGTWTDVGIAAVLALFTGGFSMLMGRKLQESGSFEPIVAALITVLAYLAAHAFGGAQVANIVVASLIILMPGLDLTVAITELSTGHLASGTNRLAGASVILIKLALGVLLATQAMQGLGFGREAMQAPQSVSPDWFSWAILVAAGFAFAVLFNAMLKDYIAVVTAALAAYLTSYFGTEWIGPELGVFLAALVVAALSNFYGRLFNRPGTILRLPGIILLVPGSLGYRALTLLFSRNVTDGIDAAVSVALVLASLVGGLLLGNTLIPPRRNL